MSEDISSVTPLATPSVVSPSLANEPATPSDRRYAPGLGQAVWGQPWQEFEAPPLLDAALQHLAAEMDRVLGNIGQGKLRHIRPFENSGSSFRCAGFTACAYSWSDDAQPWNFKHPKSGLQVSWYKWLGRGMSTNIPATPDLIARVLDHSVAHLRAVEAGAPWDEPGLYPEGAEPNEQEGITTAPDDTAEGR